MELQMHVYEIGSSRGWMPDCTESWCRDGRSKNKTIIWREGHQNKVFPGSNFSAILSMTTFDVRLGTEGNESKINNSIVKVSGGQKLMPFPRTWALCNTHIYCLCHILLPPSKLQNLLSMAHALCYIMWSHVAPGDWHISTTRPLSISFLSLGPLHQPTVVYTCLHDCRYY